MNINKSIVENHTFSAKRNYSYLSTGKLTIYFEDKVNKINVNEVKEQLNINKGLLPNEFTNNKLQAVIQKLIKPVPIFAYCMESSLKPAVSKMFEEK